MNTVRTALIGLALLSWGTVHASDPASAGERASASYIRASLHYYNAGEFENSIRAAESALELTPGLDVAYNNICCARIRLGAYDEAIAACDEALEINPQFERARANLAWAYEKSIEQEPTLRDYVGLSFTRYRQGRLDESIAALNRALELEPDSAIVHNNLCATHARRQEWDLAVEACDRALEIAPDFERARQNLDWARSGKQGAQ